ncbi:MAG: type II/IV secretion system protein [Actinobacteria bacterium]|nr:type II/IV secretion system protein [Actinomycetota bacterium]
MEAARSPWPALGALLVRNGAITAEQLEMAIEAKRLAPQRRLGEILVEQGSTTRAAIGRVLAEQHDLEFIDLKPSTVNLDAAMMRPEALAKRYNAIPIRILEDGSVLVAVADPTNVMFSDELRLAIGAPLRVCVAAGDAIAAVIDRTYEHDVGGTLETVSPTETEDATDLDLGNDTPAVLFVNKSIAKGLDIGASDIHFAPQAKRLFVRARVDGVMREIGSISSSTAPAVSSRLKIMAGLDIAERRAPQDGRVTIRRGPQTVDIRVAVLPTTNGEKVTLRVLSQGEAPGSLTDLGMWPRSHAALENAIRQPFGSVVVVGPTGSGKTTTLYACLQELNDPDRSLVTLEDPVEYRAPGLDQIEINPRAGLTFASGLRTILRSDPDVILVGEIRDEETAHIAFRAAMTGHLVLTTLHAQSAAAAIQRLVDMRVDRGIIATSINCFVAQRLVRRLCRDCMEPYTPEPSEISALNVPLAFAEMAFHRSVGCSACLESGYRGRAAIFEVMSMTDEIAMLVGAPTREIEATAIKTQGMLTLRDDGVRLGRRHVARRGSAGRGRRACSLGLAVLLARQVGARPRYLTRCVCLPGVRASATSRPSPSRRAHTRQPTQPGFRIRALSRLLPPVPRTADARELGSKHRRLRRASTVRHGAGRARARGRGADRGRAPAAGAAAGVCAR